MDAGCEQSLSESDEVLGAIIKSLPRPEIQSTYDVFFDLMSCVLEQQIHYRSTKKIFQKTLDAAELDWLTPDNFHVLEQRGLQAVKLAGDKRETAFRVVDYWDQHSIDWTRLKDDEVRQRLSSIKGVGRWSMDMILLYTLDRPDVFPADDFHLKQIMVETYGLDPNSKLRSQMLAVSEKWASCRSLAVKYLLAFKDAKKKAKL